MKLAVSTYSLSRWMKESNKSMGQVIDWIGDHAEGVEFVNFEREPGPQAKRKVRALRKRAEDRGLGIAGYCCGANLLTADDAEQRRRVDVLKRHVELAAEWGAATMRHDVTGGFPDDWTGRRTINDAIRRVVPAIREVCDFAASHEVKTSLENHGFYLQASQRVAKLIDAVDHVNYGLTIDLGNFLCVNEEPTGAVKRLAEHVIMAHAKDFHVKSKRSAPDQPGAGWMRPPTEIALRGAIAGHGNVDLPQCLKLLKKAGYNGWLSLEFEGIEEPRRGVELGLAYLRDLPA